MYLLLGTLLVLAKCENSINKESIDYLHIVGGGTKKVHCCGMWLTQRSRPRSPKLGLLGVLLEALALGFEGIAAASSDVQTVLLGLIPQISQLYAHRDASAERRAHNLVYSYNTRL